MGQLTLRDYLQTTEDAISAGRIDDALVSCQHILAQYPHSLEAQRLLGEAYLAQGQLEKAQQAFDWVLTNDPENVVTYCSRALISQRMQDYDTALDCYQQAYELSRGNSQIRQEFNQLSLSVGQAHFVFSRAGLARLYMRGDLLPQAIQEWETILATTPDRLDAQTGLLETYWREGWYDRVEQLGHQVLDEVPGCLKALLLLAHVTYPKNTQQAQQYLKLAETLDPDMVMAHELFGDMIVNQPTDPFWVLLKKAPAVIDQQIPIPALAAAAPSNGNGHSTGNHSAVTATPYADSLVRWDSLDSILEPQQEYQPGQDASSLLTWAETDTSAPSWANAFEEPAAPTQPGNDLAESLRFLTPQPDTTPENASPATRTEATETHPAAPEPYEIPTNPPTEQPGAEQSWYPVEMFEELDAWNKSPDAASASPLASDNQDAEIPAPPAWLEMLTGSSWQQPTESPAEALPVEQSAEPTPAPIEPIEPPAYETPLSMESQYEEPDYSAALFQNQDIADEDEDEHSFGPQWLRSLGASLINDETPPATDEPAAPVDAPSFTPAAPPVDMPTEATPAPEPVSWQSSPTWQAAPDEQADLAPLSALAPDTLPADSRETSSISPFDDWMSQAAEKLAQPDQNVLTTLEALESDLRSRGFVQLEPGTLSAFAQEEEAEPEPAPFSAPATAPLPAAPFVEETSPSEVAEPLWAATVNSAAQTSAPPVAPAPAPAFTASVPPAPEPAVSMPLMGSPDLLLDAQLEATMKRPAIRLQPMSQRPSVHASAALRGHSAEHPAPHPATEGNLSKKERLLKGYQFQLAGSYDEAMQEYRVIIRNAPEFLGEVISNMRALLKIAPKYGPGYRVLGDAYMRQGEYLQAMEAYNKALSMTRRGK